MANITLDSFRTALNYNATTHKFTTAAKKTRGTLTLDGRGGLQSHNRKWYQFQSPNSDAQANFAVRNALIKALLADGKSIRGFANSDFMQRVYVQLGISGLNGPKIVNGGEFTAEKPLERRLVKQILDDYKELMHSAFEVIGMDEVVNENNLTVQEAIIKSREHLLIPKMEEEPIQSPISKQKKLEPKNLEQQHATTIGERETLIANYANTMALRILETWPVGTQQQQDKFRQLFGNCRDFTQIAEKIKTITQKRMLENRDFWLLFHGKTAKEDLINISNSINYGYILAFKQFCKNENAEDGIVCLDALTNKMPGKEHKRLLQFITSLTTSSGPSGWTILSEDAKTINYGFRTQKKEWNFGKEAQPHDLIKRPLGLGKPSQFDIQVTKDTIILKQQFAIGEVFSEFEGIPIDKKWLFVHKCGSRVAA